MPPFKKPVTDEAYMWAEEQYLESIDVEEDALSEIADMDPDDLPGELLDDLVTWFASRQAYATAIEDIVHQHREWPTPKAT